MPTIHTLFWGAALCISLVGCQSSEQKTFTLRTPESLARETTALAIFSSEADDSIQVELRLQADSTFLLEMTPRQAPVQTIRGALEIADERYRLLFPDTVAHLNELITPVHPDASVIVYPDYSVALDKALTQLYVRGVLVSIDTLAK